MQSNDDQLQAAPGQSLIDRATDQRVPVPEAAKILGISPEAVRARMQRGTLSKDKASDGTVYVRLTVDQMRSNGNRTGTSSSDQSPDQSAYVEELREQIAFLRGVISTRDEELRQEREARIEEKRRHDTIVLQLAQRIPELEASPEASPEPRDGPVTASEDRSNGMAVWQARSDAEKPVERRSWLSRFFFGP